MTDINDVPQVNALYLEQQQVQSAMYYLANGGTLTNITVAPPPYVPPDPTDPGINPQPVVPSMTGGPMMMMTVSITLQQPVPPELIADAKIALQQRNDEINAELAALGVTGTRGATSGTRPGTNPVAR